MIYIEIFTFSELIVSLGSILNFQHTVSELVIAIAFATFWWYEAARENKRNKENDNNRGIFFYCTKSKKNTTENKDGVKRV